MAVPIHHGNCITSFNPQFRQSIGQSANPLAEFGIGKAEVIAVDNLLLRIIDRWSLQQVFDQEWIGISGFGSSDQIVRHQEPP